MIEIIEEPEHPRPRTLRFARPLAESEVTELRALLEPEKVRLLFADGHPEPDGTCWSITYWPKDEFAHGLLKGLVKGFADRLPSTTDDPIRQRTLVGSGLQ